MTEISVKRGDTKVLFTDTLTANGAPIPGGIAGATVLFLLADQNTGALYIAAAATIVNAVACTVSYVTADGELDVAADCRQEWQATLATGERYTFPSTGYNTVHVLDDLGP